MIVITLSKVPPSLRGDLTKWYQEIQTGVYVGDVSAKIREKIWERITRDIGSGEATMVYNAANEFGYQFKTTRRDHEVADFDGVPLMMHLKDTPAATKLGFSTAAKRHQARKFQHVKASKPISIEMPSFVALDLETTGLEPMKNEILSIGAVKVSSGSTAEQLALFVESHQAIPPQIQQLTGITPEILRSQGKALDVSLQQLQDFIGELPVVGYNVDFDIDFLSRGRQHVGLDPMNNRVVDVLPVVKRTNSFLDNYHLATVLKAYEIENTSPHHAISDALATAQLAMKLMQNKQLRI